MPSEKSAQKKSPAGKMIGPYKLIRLVGEGGMGNVYLAEQLRPIRRTVALKIIKVGMDTHDFIARFESERQALAKMDHPYIARVHDAGATEQGRPYLVMEYVPGVPLLQYCDEKRLGITERLELFIKICEGIQHAHQKAIIHRDLKSSNVLVVQEDGEAWPKIIDFGVAKVLGPKITEQTIQTQMGQILGTPQYMSPEQADLTGGSIDTRTDVYLLGEVLYELLAGLQPFDSKQLLASGLDGMLYKIRMVDPPRPSIRLREFADGAEAIAGARGLTLGKLCNSLAGDLDWIVMMAIEKSPDLRYQTAHAIIADLRNYGNSLPIIAHPPTGSYRIRKFVNRHRTGVIAATVISLAVVLGAVGTTTGMIRSRRAEKMASIEAAAAKEVADFMVGLFNVSDPGEARGRAVTAWEILQEGARRIENGLSSDPATQARLMGTMGRVYMELGLYDESQELLGNSLDTMVKMGAGRDPQTAAILNDFGHLQRETGQFRVARTYLEMGLEIREKKFGPDHDLVAESLNSLGNLLYATGEYPAALKLYERALTIREKKDGTMSREVAIVLKNIGAIYLVTRQYDLAEAALARSLAIREVSLSANHPDISNSLTALAVCYDGMDEPSQALDYFERSLAIRETVYGPNHPRVAENLSGMARVLGNMGNFERSGKLFTRALQCYRDAYGDLHPKVGETLISYGYVLFDAGEADRAVAMVQEGVDILAQGSEARGVEMQRGLETVGLFKLKSNDPQAALDYFLQVREMQTETFGADYGLLATTDNNIGQAWINLGDGDKAREVLTVGLAIGEKAFGKSSPEIADCLLSLGYLDMSIKNYESAGTYLHRANRILTDTYGAESRDTALSASRLGLLAFYQGHLQEARKWFDEAVAVQSKLLPANHVDLVQNHYNLACVNAKLGDNAAAMSHLRAAVDNGFTDSCILTDEDLDPLRDEPEFTKLEHIATADD